MAPQKGPQKGPKKALGSASSSASSSAPRIVQKSASSSALRIVPRSASSSASSSVSESAQERADRAARRVVNKKPNIELYTAEKAAKYLKKMQKIWTPLRKFLERIIDNKKFKHSTTYVRGNLIEELKIGKAEWGTFHVIHMTPLIIKLCKALLKGDNPRKQLEDVLSHNTWPLTLPEVVQAQIVSAEEISNSVSGDDSVLKFLIVLRTIIGHQYVEAGTVVDLSEFIA